MHAFCYSMRHYGYNSMHQPNLATQQAKAAMLLALRIIDIIAV